MLYFLLITNIQGPFYVITQNLKDFFWLIVYLNFHLNLLMFLFWFLGQNVILLFPQIISSSLSSCMPLTFYSIQFSFFIFTTVEPNYKI
jgi:hypothetical protein